MFKVAVVVASTGRPAIVRQCLSSISNQTYPPETIVLSVAAASDIPPEVVGSEQLDIVYSPKGLTRQRNAGIDLVLGNHDLIAFLDDDFLLSSTYLEEAARAFERFDRLVALDGLVVADGAVQGELGWTEAADILRSFSSGDDSRAIIWNHPDMLYGCNMVFRATLFEKERFDEALPLYGWLEDRDISIRAARHGDLARLKSAVGVHLGVKGGRVGEKRLGYSQVANPVYLARSGVFDRRQCVWSVTLRVVGNLVGLLADRSGRFDRSGRLKGNGRALWDLLRQRDSPSRVVDLVP